MDRIYFYSPTTRGFYTPEIHGENMPTDVVEISNEYYEGLLYGMGEGKSVVPDENGLPILQDLPEPVFSDLQAAKIAEINAAFAEAASALTAGYPEAERMTWATQQAEALAWAADGSAPTPYLDGLATARGIAPEQMRQKTLDQTQLFMTASQHLVGKRQRLRDLAYAAESPEELDAIQWDEP